MSAAQRSKELEMTSRYPKGLFAAALAVVAAGCSGSEASEVDNARVGRVVSVEVASVSAESFTSAVQIVGSVHGRHDVTVSTEEAGVVRQLLAEKGSWVEAGQPIVRLDDGVLRAQAQQADAQARLAVEQFERQRRLWEDERMGSEMAYLNAKYGAETARAASRVLAERLARTIVRAPVAGVLEERHVEVGSLVSPGTPVARIVDARTVKVSGGVPERFAGEVRRGSEATIQVDALGAAELSGTVSFSGSAVHTGSRTLPIEIVVPNASGALKPGMVATVRLARGQAGEAILVPQEAVLREEGGYVLYVVGERDGVEVAVRREIVLGATQGNRVVVSAGLEAGERLIVVGQQKVAPGDRLEIVGAVG
jgi:membrane fusion protein, multidrug efflux system